MNKRFKININGIDTLNQIKSVDEIHNILKRKNTKKNLIEESNTLVISIFPEGYTDSWGLGGWHIDYNKSSPLIELKSVNGKIETFDIGKIKDEQKIKTEKDYVDKFENIIEQAKLMFLTGYFNYECAFKHIENQLIYLKCKVYLNERINRV